MWRQPLLSTHVLASLVHPSLLDPAVCCTNQPCASHRVKVKCKVNSYAGEGYSSHLLSKCGGLALQDGKIYKQICLYTQHMIENKLTNAYTAQLKPQCNEINAAAYQSRSSRTLHFLTVGLERICSINYPIRNIWYPYWQINPEFMLLVLVLRWFPLKTFSVQDLSLIVSGSKFILIFCQCLEHGSLN